MSRLTAHKHNVAAGFSVIELAAGLSITAIIALGAAYTISNTSRQSEVIKVMAEQSHVGTDLKTWMNSTSRKLSTCQSMRFGETNLETIKAMASEPTGVPFSVQIQTGRNTYSYFQEGQAYPGAAHIVIQKLRFTNAQVINSGSATGEPLTYMTGKVLLGLSTGGALTAGAGSASSGPGEQALSDSVLGQITVGVSNSGAVKSCSTNESIGSAAACDGIDTTMFSAESCALELSALSNKYCSAGFTYAGFNYESNNPVCVESSTGCHDSVTGTRSALAGLKRVPTGESTLNSVPTVSNVTVCASIPNTPPPVPGVVPTPAPTNTVVDLGGPGTVECPNPSAYADWYNACLQLQAYYAQRDSGHQITCPSAPSKCFTTVATQTPATIPTNPPATPAESPGMCDCGAVPTVSNGQFCGSYYASGLGYVNQYVKSSVVYRCNDGRLEMLSGATVRAPSNSEWTYGQLRQATNVTGSVYQLQ